MMIFKLLLFIPLPLFSQILVERGIYSNVQQNQIVYYNDTFDIHVNSQITIDSSIVFISHDYFVNDSYVCNDGGYIDLLDRSIIDRTIFIYMIRDNDSDIVKGCLLHRTWDDFIIEVYEGLKYNFSSYPNLYGKHLLFNKH